MKLRLGMALACVTLLAGCPDATDDMRRARGEAGDPSVAAEFVEGEYVCVNVRPWREDLDLPEYLKNPTPAAELDSRDNAEATRERRRKEYIASHEGTLTVCHTVLEKDAASNRGTCPICTAMLKDKQWIPHRIAKTPGQNVYDVNDPIELRPDQEFTDKVEFRLTYKSEDYLKKAEDQIASYREWLQKRNLGPIITGWENPNQPIVESDPQKVVEIYVERAKNRGLFTKDEANPKSLPKFGLPPLAEPLIRCPTCKKPVNSTESRCWNCNTAYTVAERDERNSITEPHEVLCPYCKSPMQTVDPTLNYCEKCQKFHRAIDREGTCWRCGGSGICPECLGSGKGHGPIEGGDECYLCGGGKTPGASAGQCPECGGTGFTTYEGGLPPGFKGDHRAKGDWKLASKPAAAAAVPANKPADSGGEGGEK